MSHLIAPDVVVLELRVALNVREDGNKPLGIEEGVSLEGRDELGREDGFKAILELRKKPPSLLKVRDIMENILIDM